MALSLQEKKEILGLGRKLTLDEKKFVLSKAKGETFTAPPKGIFPEFSTGGGRSISEREDLPQLAKTAFGSAFPSTAQRKPTTFEDTRDLELTGPTKEGELPILTATGKSPEQQSIEFGGGFASDILSTPERLLGAALNKDEGRSFLDELQDPNASVTKEVQKALRESDAPTALKILGTIGLSTVSDPLSILTGVMGLVKVGKSAVKAGARKISPQGAALELGEDITEQVGKIAPEGATIPKKIKGIETTPGEQQLLGKSPDEKILQTEALARKQAPAAVERITKSREGFLQNKLDDVIDKSGVKSLQLGSDELVGDVAKGFDFAFKKNAKEVKSIFKNIEEVGNVKKIDNSLLKNAKANVENIELGGVSLFKGSPKLRGVEDLTQAEISSLAKAGKFSQIKKGNFFDDAGNIVEDAATKTKKLTQADLAKAGITKPVADKVDEFKDIMSTSLSYSQIKNARGSIFQIENALNRGVPGPNDFKVLKQLRKEYTETMENHLRNVGGDDMVDQFRKVNTTFGDETKGSFKVLEKNFYRKNEITKRLELKPNREIFESITSSVNVGTKLDELKKILPEEAYGQLRNAYFNNLMEKSTRNGILEPKKFLAVMEKTKKDPFLWDNLLTPAMKDEMADMITDAVVLEKLAKFKTPKAKEAALSSMLKGSGSNFMKWAIWHKFGGVAAGVFSLAKRATEKAAQNLETKQAVDFFKGVSPIQFGKALKAGGKSAVQEGIIFPTRKFIEEETTPEPEL